MADLVKLGTCGPGFNGQLHRARQFAQLIDVAVEFGRLPPGVTGCFGHRATVVVHVRVEASGKRGINRFHVLNRLGPCVLGGAHGRHGIEQLGMAAFAVAHHQVRRRQPGIVPGQGVGMVQVEHQPGHHAGAIDLHVGVTQRVFTRTDASRGFVVAAPRHVRRFQQ
ncbi:hypothetical protein ALP10_200244 [Pseudomonas syringae pv. helianthi]|uniref:Uncharacterized protein n=1 Tax=Pseudomonas syringae pv. helianthi TaxID=251654 RepID=A0A3M4RMQ7_9PSED|nr:hypothetical protein ALP93_200304 [Pseudomonas syringae pv. helianthi]RMV51244.1 hypothetical protein ALP10_200244 [Pseudomonas syringae pv. helianthi]